MSIVLYEIPVGTALEPLESIRVISVGAFRRRFTLAEKVAMKVSTDPAVLVLQEDLLSSSFVDLDFTGLIEALEYLKSIGILTEERVVELRRDGVQEEKP